MKKHYKTFKSVLSSVATAVAITFLSFNSTEVKAQAAVTCTPANTNGCGSGDYINSFSLNNIAAVGNAGCNGAAAGFTAYTSPVWTLLMGVSYPWTVTHGPSWSQSFSIWIDYNNDGFYTSNEQVANTAVAALAHNGNFTIPTTATAGSNIRMRIRCQFSTLIGTGNNEACTAYTYGETEDYLVNLIAPTPCGGTPAANSIVMPTNSICPGTGLTLNLSTSYTTTGLTYQWGTATNPSGPFTPISGATAHTLATGNVPSNTYYNVIVTCANSGPSASIAPSGLLMVSGTITNTIPYSENFEGITTTNQLPNCSWTKSSNNAQTYTVIGTNNRQPRSGTKFASFYSPGGTAGTNSFYSNGLQLEPGITYSASVWYTTESYGYTNFKLTMSIGQTQTQTGLVTLAGGGAVASPVYKEMANTFTVASSGIYYLNLKADHDNTYGAYYLSWDDLSVTIPCSLNSPTITLQTSTTSICEGEGVTLNVSGADTYTWSTGSNAATISETPTTNIVYTVVGTNALTGCDVSSSQSIMVNETPEVYVYANQYTVCSGSPANISAFGDAVSYLWNVGNGANVTVMPTAAVTGYTVIATANNGCTATKNLNIHTNPLPTVLATSNRPGEICPKESVALTASGAVSYQWASDASSSLYVGTTINVVLNALTNFTVTGTDANGCVNKSTITQNVGVCSGISENAMAAGLNLYPNPTSGALIVELTTSTEINLQVTDLSGRLVAEQKSNDQKTVINMNNLSAGIYYVKVQTSEFSEIFKVVKQ